MAGIKVDESSVRYYPLDELFSKVIGFAGADGQGVVGLEIHMMKFCVVHQGGYTLYVMAEVWR